MDETLIFKFHRSNSTTISYNTLCLEFDGH